MFMITKKDSTGTARGVQFAFEGIRLRAMNKGFEEPTIFVRRTDAEAAVRMIAKMGGTRGLQDGADGMKVVEGRSTWGDGPRLIAVTAMDDAYYGGPVRAWIGITDDGTVKRVAAEAEAAVFADPYGAMAAKSYVSGRLKLAERDEWLTVVRPKETAGTPGVKPQAEADRGKAN